MLHFPVRKKTKDGVPIMSAADMDELAEALIRDYKPSLLKDPQPLDAVNFTQAYMGLELHYLDLTPDQSILGMVTFEDGIAEVYDHQAKQEKYLRVSEGWVMIDSHLLKPDKRGRLRFTTLHESGGHWWCHRHLHRKPKGQIKWDFNNRSTVVKCRINTIENFALRTFSSPGDWLEWQADYMASALAMPKTTFRAAAEEIIKNTGVEHPFIITGIDADYDVFAEHGLPEIIADFFGVSKQAAQIKLKKFGYIKDIKKYEQENRQIKII